MSHTAVAASDFRLCNLLRDQPRVEGVAHTVSAGAVPALRREDLDIELLAGGDIDIPVLIEIAIIAHRRDVVMPGRNVAVKRAAVCDRPVIAAIHVDIREIEALGGQPVTVEPDPGLAGRNRRRCNCNLSPCRRFGAARRGQHQDACPLEPSSWAWSGSSHHRHSLLFPRRPLGAHRITTLPAISRTMDMYRLVALSSPDEPKAAARRSPARVAGSLGRHPSADRRMV